MNKQNKKFKLYIIIKTQETFYTNSESEQKKNVNEIMSKIAGKKPTNQPIAFGVYIVVYVFVEESRRRRMFKYKITNFVCDHNIISLKYVLFGYQFNNDWLAKTGFTNGVQKTSLWIISYPAETTIGMRPKRSHTWPTAPCRRYRILETGSTISITRYPSNTHTHTLTIIVAIHVGALAENAAIEGRLPIAGVGRDHRIASQHAENEHQNHHGEDTTTIRRHHLDGYV